MTEAQIHVRRAHVNYPNCTYVDELKHHCSVRGRWQRPQQPSLLWALSLPSPWALGRDWGSLERRAIEQQSEGAISTAYSQVFRSTYSFHGILVRGTGVSLTVRLKVLLHEQVVCARCTGCYKEYEHAYTQRDASTRTSGLCRSISDLLLRCPGAGCCRTLRRAKGG